MSKSWDKVCTPNDLIRIEERERILWVIEPNPWISLVSETRSETRITTKPAHIEEWDVLYLGGITSMLKMANADVKYSNDPTIPERMRVGVTCLMRKCHKVSVVPWVQ